MKTLKNIIVKPSILVVIFISLATLVIFSAYYELTQSKKEMLLFMSEEAHSLLQSIIISSQEVLYASDEVEAEIQSRLLNNANAIKILYEKKIVNNKILSEIAFENGINRIHIVNKKGVRIFTSHPNINHKAQSAEIVKKKLE